MNGFETILPFLKPIEHLILDDSISEVMVNGPHRVFVDANRIPLLEVFDLVLDLHPRTAADEDVNLLLVLVLMAEGQSETWRYPAVAEPRLFEPQRNARHAELEIGREAEIGRLIVGVLEIEMCVVAHGCDCNRCYDPER